MKHNRKYHLTYHLVEGSEADAQAYRNDCNARMTPYGRKAHPATYTTYTIKDNYGPGQDWNGRIVWHYYTTC